MNKLVLAIILLLFIGLVSSLQYSIRVERDINTKNQIEINKCIKYGGITVLDKTRKRLINCIFKP